MPAYRGERSPWVSRMSKGPPQRLIRLDAPSVGLNGEKILNKTRLTRNIMIPNGGSNEKMVARIKPGDKHLVFNCHGIPAKNGNKAFLAIGQMLFEDNVDVCAPWRNIQTLAIIWLSACNIGGSGLNFCKKLAVLTRCYVVTCTGPALDRQVKVNTIEDNYTMPQYIDPFGSMVTREAFFALGPNYGFSRVN